MNKCIILDNFFIYVKSSIFYIYSPKAPKESKLNGLKKFFIPTAFNVALERLEPNGLNEVLVYADNINLSGKNTRVIKSRRMRWAAQVMSMGEIRSAYKILVQKPEGKRPLGRHKHRWKYNIQVDLREIGGRV
jgi:hypothetical protein